MRCVRCDRSSFGRCLLHAMAGTLALVCVCQSATGRAEEKLGSVRIGAVASSPGTVTVFTDMCRYLSRGGLPADFVLYSNYDMLVAALERGEVDIAWNTPLAACASFMWPRSDTARRS